MSGGGLPLSLSIAEGLSRDDLLSGTSVGDGRQGILKKVSFSLFESGANRGREK
jgi:hypothetical protein